MKKIISMLLVFSLLIGCSAAFAEGFGVQVIGGPETESEPVSLDNVKLGREIEIEGYGILCPDKHLIEEGFCVYKAGSNQRVTENRAGSDADFLIFYMDITNNTASEKDYLGQVSVKVVFDGVYEYGGWYFQRNYNNKTWGSRSDAPWTDYNNKQNTMYGIDHADEFSIGPWYQGHYIFGCTLPNAVLNSTKPLKMIITLDGNEITYNVRK